MLLLELFGRFFVAGLFAVGGGLATLPFLQKMGEATGWFGAAQISDMVAISESTPGPLGVNMATYVGFQVAGVPGALVGVLGLIAPSVIVILIVAQFLKRFRESKYVGWAFYGLRAASLGLIVAACWAVMKIALWNADAFAQSGGVFQALRYENIVLCVLVFIGVQCFKKIHPIVFIAIAAAAGVGWHLLFP
ncbi:MAG: chromate transporter [Clostridia bacterium]|nr:chromate transporter [Clostridia bacterium]